MRTAAFSIAHLRIFLPSLSPNNAVFDLGSLGFANGEYEKFPPNYLSAILSLQDKYSNVIS